MLNAYAERIQVYVNKLYDTFTLPFSFTCLLELLNLCLVEHGEDVGGGSLAPLPGSLHTCTFAALLDEATSHETSILVFPLSLRLLRTIFP